MNLFSTLKKNNKIIIELAKNDFETRFAGSYLGIIWAFVQPLVMILMYVFIFQVAFKADPTNGSYPYVLWLIAGLIPWFFFSEAVSNATSCFFEYSYLVKKVVFPIGILPIIKIVSAFFIHITFMVIAIIIYICLGYAPGLFFAQILYYMMCMLVLIVAIGFLTSSIVPFFRDLKPIVNIVLTIGMWATPILWDLDAIPFLWVRYIVILNPVYYIVMGYRDSFMNGPMFWQRFDVLAVFWIETGILLFLGLASYKKMRPHFADVL